MRCFVFPGQGSQYPGMGQELARAFPEARAVFEEADEVLGYRLSRLCFEGPADALMLTEKTQPALLATSIAVFRVVEQEGHRPDFVAGHSLGEYSALVASGALELADALRLVRERGRLMQEAVPVGEGAMAAIVGLGLEEVEEICRQASRGQVVCPANHNSPVQIAISGHFEAVARASTLAKERGARRAIELPVSAPFHSPLMEPVRQAMESRLSETKFHDLNFPLVNNVDANIVTAGDAAREGLLRQIPSMVRWTQSVQCLFEQGVRQFVEIGPGKVLVGLIRRTLDNVELENIEDPRQVRAYA